MPKLSIFEVRHNSFGGSHFSLIARLLDGAPNFGKAIDHIVLKAFFDDTENTVPGGGSDFEQYQQDLKELPLAKYSKRNKNLTIEYLSRACLGIDLNRQAQPRDRDDIFVNNSARIFRSFYHEMIDVLDQQLPKVLGRSDDFDVTAFIAYLKRRASDLPQRNQQLYELWRHGTARHSIDFSPPARQPMSDHEFWKIIAHVDQDALDLEHGEEAIQPVIDQLTRLTAEAIESFQCTLVNKLFALDTLAHARGAEETSDDAFLYVRCFTVGKGRDFYERALAAPQFMPKDPPWFESLLHAAANAWAVVTHDDPMNFERITDKTYETGGNVEGWNVTAGSEDT